MSAAAAARARRLDRAVRAGRRCGRRRARRPRSGGERRAVVRHGRNVMRRRASSTAAACARPPRGRSPDGCFSCRWSTCTPSAPAAEASAGPMPVARCGSGRSPPVPSPGPPATGAAATEPTVTDANLAARLPGGRRAPGRRLSLDAEAAGSRAAQARRAARPGREETAGGIVRVADQEMVRALRVVTVERGVDPRGYALVAFGGAGPMHARAPRRAARDRASAAAARRRRAVGARAGRLAAAGATCAQRAAVGRGHWPGVERSGRGARLRAARELPGARVEISFDLRYRGPVVRADGAAAADAAPARLRERFERAHEDRYGYAIPTPSSSS